MNRKFFSIVGFAVFLFFSSTTMRHAVAFEAADPTVKMRYVKIDAYGNELHTNATDWSCVNDLETDLFWAVSLPSSRHSVVEKKVVEKKVVEKKFRWGGLTMLQRRLGRYIGDNRRALGVKSVARVLAFDDWSETVSAHRKTKLCGLDNWRVPSLYELSGLASCESGKRADLDKGCGKKQSPFVFATEYFPDTKNGYYWSGTPSGVTNTAHYAWAVHSSDGSDASRYTGNQYYVRLVGSR